MRAYIRNPDDAFGERALACILIAAATVGFFWAYGTAKNYAATPDVELARFTTGSLSPRIQSLVHSEAPKPDMDSPAVSRALADVSLPAADPSEGPASVEETRPPAAKKNRKSSHHQPRGYDAFAQAPVRRGWSVPYGGF